MRALAAVGFLGVLAGCHCSPDTPQQVTLRVRNTAPQPIFVDDTGGKLGLAVQRKLGTEWRGFVEAPPCGCLACDQVCSGCLCADGGIGAPTVRRVLPGESYTRTWSGVVQVDSVNGCGTLGGGASCLRAENAPLDETFQLQLCYAYSAAGLPPVGDGGTAPGSLPEQGRTCVARAFRPVDLEAEVSPERGADCVGSADCKGKDELCFSGACTAGCPANDFPALSSTWVVRVASVDDQGFFARAALGTQTVYTGAGTLGSALYNSNALTLRFTRPGPSGGALTAGLDLTLPRGYAPPFTAGQAVAVQVIDASSTDNPENRAIVIRDGAGVLLLAADVGQGGALLSATDLAPFSATFESAIVGCRVGDCGKELQSTLRLGGPAGTIVLQPGNSALQASADGTWRLLNVGNSTWATTTCRFKVLRPFLLYREKAP